MMWTEDDMISLGVTDFGHHCNVENLEIYTAISYRNNLALEIGLSQDIFSNGKNRLFILNIYQWCFLENSIFGDKKLI